MVSTRSKSIKVEKKRTQKQSAAKKGKQTQALVRDERALRPRVQEEEKKQTAQQAKRKASQSERVDQKQVKKSKKKIVYEEGTFIVYFDLEEVQQPYVLGCASTDLLENDQEIELIRYEAISEFQHRITEENVLVPQENIVKYLKDYEVIRAKAGNKRGQIREIIEIKEKIHKQLIEQVEQKRLEAEEEESEFEDDQDDSSYHESDLDDLEDLDDKEIAVLNWYKRNKDNANDLPVVQEEDEEEKEEIPQSQVSQRSKSNPQKQIQTKESQIKQQKFNQPKKYKAKQQAKKDQNDEEIKDEANNDIEIINTCVKKEPLQQNIGLKRKRQSKSQVKQQAEEDGEVKDKLDDGEMPLNKRRKVGKNKEVKVKKPRAIKKPLEFKLGKWNPNIEVLDINKESEEANEEMILNCCVRCNGRNCIRAVKTRNKALLLKSLKQHSDVANPFCYWSPEQQTTALDLLVKSNDSELLEIAFYPEKHYSEEEKINLNLRNWRRAFAPEYMIKSTDSGMVSNMAYGRKVRRVQQTRGNKQGNNAFLQDKEGQPINALNNLTNDNFIHSLLSIPTLEFDFLANLMKAQYNLLEIIQNYVHLIVRSGNYKLAYKIIEKMVNFSFFGFGQLHLDVLSSDNRDLDKVLKQSVTKKATSCKNITPLDCACINPNSKYLEMLLEAQPEIIINDSDMRRPLHYAAACENPYNMEKLLEAGANIHDLDNEKKNCLHIAAISGREKNVRLILEKNPGLIKTRDIEGMDAMAYACKLGHIEVVKVLFSYKAKKNAGCGNDKLPPLSWAAAYGHFDLVKYLLEIKARTLSKDKFKRTPLTMAVRNGETKIASLLLQHGSDWDHNDSSFNTPLHYAAAYGWLDCIELLLKAGANVNAENAWKLTPINIAILKHHKGCFKRLLQEDGVDLNVKDEKGQSFLMISLQQTFDENTLDFVEFLLKKGADPNIPDLSGNYPIHLVVSYAPRLRNPNQYGQNNYFGGYNNVLTQEEQQFQRDIQFKLIHLLLDYKADYSVANGNGKTAFDLSLDMDNVRIVEIFLQSVSLNERPNTMFTILGKCLKIEYQTLFKKIVEREPLIQQTLNFTNAHGQNLFIFAFNTLTSQAQQYDYNIQMLIRQQYQQHTIQLDKYQITHEDIFDKIKIQQFQQNQNWNYNMPFDINHRVDYFRAECIIKPFIQFMEYMIELGFNPQAVLQKPFTLLGHQLMDEIARKEYDILKKGEVKEIIIEKQDLQNIQINSMQYEMVQSMLLKEHKNYQQKLRYNFNDQSGKNAFHIVVNYPQPLLLDFLFKYGVDFDRQDAQGYTPFMQLCFQRSMDPINQSLFDILIQRGARIDLADFQGNTPFLKLYERNYYQQAFKLLDLGADIHRKNFEGNYALRMAFNKGTQIAIKELMSKGVNINQVDDQGRNLLHLAMNKQSNNANVSFEFEHFLIDQGVNLNTRDHRGRTPLHYAFVKIKNWQARDQVDPIEAVSSLCGKKGLEIDVPDLWLKTPLHYAAQRGASICSLYLINRGAQLERKDIYGNTPLGIGLTNNHFHYGIILIQKSASVLPPIYTVLPQPAEVIYKQVNQRVFELYHKKRIEIMNSYEEEIKLNTDQQDQNAMIIDTGLGNNPSQEKPLQFSYGLKICPKDLDSTDKNQDYLEQVYEDFKKINPQQSFSMFKFAIKHGQQGLSYLLIDEGYDLMLAIQDAIDENIFLLVLTLLSKVSDDEIVRKSNSKQQNLFHVMGINANNCANSDHLRRILEAFRDRGVDHNAIDQFGKTPLHYATQTKNLQMIQFLLKECHGSCDVNVVDNEGHTPITLLMQGQAIKPNLALNGIFNLLVQHKADLNHVYPEKQFPNDYYQPFEFSMEDYQTTILINFYRQGKQMNDFIYNLDVLQQHGARLDVFDSEQRDIFVYAILENDFDLIRRLLLNFSKDTWEQNKSHLDIYGKSHTHYLVDPWGFGTFENSALLTLLHENGFNIDLPDTEHGKTPYQYALQQPGDVKKVFQRLLNIKEEGDSLLENESEEEDDIWPDQVYDFKKEALDYVEEQDEEFRKEQETKKDVVQPDPTGGFQASYKVYYGDNEKPWDVYLTKIDLMNGPYGEYLFYRMQLLHDVNRDLYVVFTRWGRIGEDGMNQRSPFPKIEDAREDFKKIFGKKTGGNDFENLEAFQRHPKKYTIPKMKKQQQFKASHFKDYDQHNCPKSSLPYSVFTVMSEFGDIRLYQSTFQNYGIDLSGLRLQQMTKQTLIETRDLLKEINEIIIEEQAMRNEGLQADYDKLLEIKKKIYKKSNEFYELFPLDKYKNSIAPPLNINNISQYLEMIDKITNLRYANQILLGALKNQLQINPMDYIYNVLNCKIEPIDQSGAESRTLMQYIRNSYPQNQLNMEIFKVTRKGEKERIRAFKDIPNHQLLFHGSGAYNFLGILSQGLLIAPPDAPVTGYNYGKGLYFADKFSKSFAYANRGKINSSFLLLCQVVLGNQKVLYNAEYVQQLEPEYHSVLGKGTQAPDERNILRMKDGTKIPFGRLVNNNEGNIYRATENEFIVYNADQVRIRYLIKVSNNYGF